MRINKASDDAAGLAISEKMRGQISGLRNAARNAQDGISLVRTAEGALNETHSILQRMRELAVQSANDTNSDSDHTAIQSEITQLTSEIDKIANTTEFNTKKLINEGSANSVVKENVLYGLKHGWLELAEDRILQAYGLTGTGSTKLQIFLDQGSPYGELAHVGGTSAVLELHIDMTDFAQGDWQNGNNNLGKGFYDDRTIAHEMTHAVMDDALGAAKMNVMQTWFKEGTAEFIPGADERLKMIIGTSGTIDSAKVTALVNRATDLLNGATWNGDDTDYSAAYIIAGFIDNNLSSGKNFTNIMSDIKASGAAGDIAVEDAIGSDTTYGSFASFVTNFATTATTYVNGLSLDWGADETDTGSIMGSDHGGSALNAENVINENNATDTTDGQPLDHFTVIWPDEVTSGLTLQIGANTGQNLTINLQDMRASALGISGEGKGLDVSTSVAASSAISLYDDAIAKVSAFRAQLGSYQNRLEHTINNLNDATVNLTDSESRIRDVDMAEEMTNFQKYNILQQAAQAMLAQANQQPQGVLQLLR